jgi:death-on-curing protein
VIFLSLEDLLHLATRALGEEPAVRDVGLVESALVRPQIHAFGRAAYPNLSEKAAALLHSLARNRALVDGNKRVALAATFAFCGMNGVRLTLANNEAYDLIVDVASGRLDEVPAIAARLERGTEPRR